MNIDHTNLLKALKHPQPEPSDAEKIKAANELHDWLHGKEADRVQGPAALS